MYLNAYQRYAAELIDEYGSLLCRQILAAVNHKFGMTLATFDGYAAQMCRYGEYEMKKPGAGCILCRKGDMPDYDIIRSFDVLAAFLPQVIWHRRSREPTSLRFFIHTAEHDKEAFVIPVRQGKEKLLADYANDTFDKEKCIVVIFLLDTKGQMQKINANLNYRLALITKDGVAFYKKDQTKQEDVSWNSKT